MNKYIILLFSTFLILSCKKNKDNESYIDDFQTKSLENFKIRHAWISLDDSVSNVDSFVKLGVSNLNYDDIIDMYGNPIYEYSDTLIHGINIKYEKEDFDLYPLTWNRDTVYVTRCWWLVSFPTGYYRYLVFDNSRTPRKPIYGYGYRPATIKHVRL